MYTFKNFGPFCIAHCREYGKHFLGVQLIALGEYPFGWQWGTDNIDHDLSILIRIFRINFFGFKKYKEGFEVWFLGFWWIK